MRTINLIVYKPGYGGHFIEFLLSLDPSTMPWVRAGSTVEEVNLSRKTHYSFKNIVKIHGHWQQHHIPFRTERESFTSFLANETYHTFCAAVHPHEFYKWSLTDLFSEHPVHVNYLLLSLSPEREYIIDAFKVSNNNFPVLRLGEEEQNKQYREEHQPIVISLDNFIIGEEAFVAEYKKMNEYLALPLHLDAAIEMYRDWYSERKFTSLLRPQNQDTPDTSVE
jgi:hypothetical protein